ncbi:MAG: penicillin acylase family protein [Xanthomonadaceae bacterium]|nr:penicillin acylase family protein [Xanthomonadaceae bacterium]
MANFSSRFIRIARRLAIILAVMLVLAVGVLWWAFSGSLATLDGERALAGLDGDTLIERDALGTVSIAAESENDAMRALGFVHAQERFFEMDLLRRSAAGELAELFGRPALDRDRERRVHRLRARAALIAAQLSPDERARFDAYTAGVNAGLAALRTRPWPYLLLRQQPRPWQTEDSALAVFAMFFDLNDSRNRRELERWQMRDGLDEALFALLTHGGSEWDVPMQGESRGNARLPGPEQLDLRGRAAQANARQYRLRENDSLPGSNNWAVAGALTRDGRAIVANDMHLGQRVPNIWFRTRLRYGDPLAVDGRIDATGVSLPGAPALVIGSNGHVAWGFTNSYGDWLDWVKVSWTDRSAGRYRTPEGEESVVIHRESMAVAGAEPEVLEVRQTRWGPVLHDLDESRSLALAWTAHRDGGLNFAMTGLLRARSLDQAMAIANASGIPPQNFVAADAQGRIGWTLMGRVPKRTGMCDAQQPIEPLAGCDWDGWREAGEVPRIVDPENHRLWTANARVVDGEALAVIGDSGYDLGARAMQIRDGLLALETVTEADLLAIQLDDRAVFLERWQQLLQRTLAQADDAAAEPAQITERWEGHARPDAVAYRLVRAFRSEVSRRVGDAYLALIESPGAENGSRNQSALAELFGDRRLNQFEGVLWPLMQERPAHLLPAGYRDWDDLLLQAAHAVVATLSEQPGGLAQRTWGERNTAAICHPLAAALPGPARSLLCMPPDPLAGDSNMPRVQSRAFGASERMVVSPGHEEDGIFHMPGGQSGHPLSPFWGAGHDDHVHGRPTPFLPGPTRHRLQLRAAEVPGVAERN